MKGGERLSEDLRVVIGKNILALRQESKMTQQAFGAVFNYSDKAVSKWERGEALPDITVLKQIADYFGVSVDHLLESEHTSVPVLPKQMARAVQRNRLIVALLSSTLVWLLATVLFIVVLEWQSFSCHAWLTFIWAVPVSAIVLLVFNSIWGRGRTNFIIISVLVWSLLAAVHLTVLSVADNNLWTLYILGVPAQIIIVLWSGIQRAVKRFMLPIPSAQEGEQKGENDESSRNV